MHRMNVVAVVVIMTLDVLAGDALLASAQAVTAFEGARLSSATDSRSRTPPSSSLPADSHKSGPPPMCVFPQAPRA